MRSRLTLAMCYHVATEKYALLCLLWKLSLHSVAHRVEPQSPCLARKAFHIQSLSFTVLISLPPLSSLCPETWISGICTVSLRRCVSSVVYPPFYPQPTLRGCFLVFITLVDQVCSKIKPTFEEFFSRSHHLQKYLEQQPM